MKIFFNSLIFLIICIGCNSGSDEKLKQAHHEEARPEPEEINWEGTWTFEDNAPVEYTLFIGEQLRGLNVCTVHATGVQTFYNLECYGANQGDYIEIYYLRTTEGVFYGSDKINKDKPILTLKFADKKILTFWDQLINNYVEQGNHTGQVCFTKQGDKIGL